MSTREARAHCTNKQNKQNVDDCSMSTKGDNQFCTGAMIWRHHMKHTRSTAASKVLPATPTQAATDRATRMKKLGPLRPSRIELKVGSSSCHANSCKDRFHLGELTRLNVREILKPAIHASRNVKSMIDRNAISMPALNRNPFLPRWRRLDGWLRA